MDKVPVLDIEILTVVHHTTDSSEHSCGNISIASISASTTASASTLCFPLSFLIIRLLRLFHDDIYSFVASFPFFLILNWIFVASFLFFLLLRSLFV